MYSTTMKISCLLEDITESPIALVLAMFLQTEQKGALHQSGTLMALYNTLSCYLHRLKEKWYHCSSGFKESLIKFLDIWSRIPAQGH